MSGDASGREEEVSQHPEWDEFPIEVSLNYPIVLAKGTPNERELTSLEVKRRLVADDLRGINCGAMSFDDTIKIISRLTTQPMNTIGRMDGKDMVLFSNMINYFLGTGQ